MDAALKKMELQRQSRSTSADVPLRLHQLPDVPLRIIVSYLPFEDAITFCGMHPAWSHLQPSVQKVELEDDLEEVYCSCCAEIAEETYFDVYIATPGLISVSMEWQWKDQGWGNRKGQISFLPGLHVCIIFLQTFFSLFLFVCFCIFFSHLFQFSDGLH